jgi:hypothetical protein
MGTVERDERAALIARNVAAAPPFTAETLEKLAVLFGPAAAAVQRDKAHPVATHAQDRLTHDRVRT